MSGIAGLVLCPEARIYDHGSQHPLRPQRVLYTWSLIQACGLLERPNVLRLACRSAEDAEIGLVHSRAYIEATRKAGHGGLYHSQSVEAFYAHVPGLKVVIPSTPADAKGLLKAAIRDPDPVMFFEHKKAYRLIKGEVPDGDVLVPIGPAAVRREGSRLTCVAWGLMVHHCLEAADTVADEGIDAEVIDLRTLRPLDKETILRSVEKTARAMIVHEDNLTGGFGAEVAAIIADQGFDHLDAPVVRVAGPDVPAMPFNHPQEEAFLPNPAKIAEAMRRLSAY